MAKRKSTKVLSWKQRRCFVLQGRLKSIRENILKLLSSTLITITERRELHRSIESLDLILRNFDSSTATLEDEVNP
jgi:hypothetical protein